MTHWAHLNIFPDEMLLLSHELRNHPKLCTLLANHPANEWEVMMVEIALYCDVIVDGSYTPEDMQRLAFILYKRLIEKRERTTGLIVIEGSAY